MDKSSMFGLEDIFCRCHVRQVTDAMQMSSHDMVYAVSALLEAPMLSEKEESDE